MYAIINYYDDPRLSEIQKVKEEDKVRSITNDFDLTIGKEYEVLEVNSQSLITIKNDIGEIDMYTIEYFKL
jgi:hypothetical protein